MAAPPLVLASRSPQRRAILEQIGVRFEAVPADVEERSEGVPRDVVVENARRKARAVARSAGEGRAVLGADTVVALGDRLLGKPGDEAEARSFLEALSGRSHEVWGGIALEGAPSTGDEGAAAVRTAAAVTEVEFRPLERPEIDFYLGTGEWRGRAGGYAIQGRGAVLVERIAGDYSNVVGLPVPELVRLMPGLAGR